MKNQQGQNYMRKQARDYRNIDSRLNQNEYKQKSFGTVSGKKFKPIFPSCFSIGWIDINNG